MNKDDNIAIEFAETVQALSQLAPPPPTKIQKAKIVELLTQFRLNVEAEAEGVSITQIHTTLGLALADVTEALDIKDPDDLLQVLGDDAYLQAYVRPIPYQLAPQERAPQEDRAALRLLSRLEEIEGWITAKRKARTKLKAEAEPSHAR